jgi:hypothetical protein
MTFWRLVNPLAVRLAGVLPCAHNIAAEPSVRLRMGGRWYAGHASVLPLDDAILRCFNRYARSGPQLVGVDPALLRIELQDVDARGTA